MGSLTTSVEEDDQSTTGGPELNPSRGRIWAEDVEHRLWECYSADHLGVRREAERETVHLMERHRERSGRRRIRPRRRSRTPERDRGSAHGRVTESIRYLGDPRDCYTPREVERGSGAAASHSEGGRHSHTGRSSSARPSSGSGHGRPGSSTDPPPPTRDLQQPLSRDEATDLWRFLLGVDRQSWPSRTRVIGAGQPFLPGAMQRDIQNHFRRMSPQNRLVMTVNFIEMIRYMMAEVSNLMHQADFLSNLPGEDMVEVVIEGEEGERDGTELMQRYLHTGGKDTNEDRWQRCLARLQKELSSQAPASRWANIRRIRQALPACEPWSTAETRREQLRALLVAMLDEVPEGVPMEAANEQWLGSWGNELEFFLPGTLFPLAVVPVPQVDSDSGEMPMDPAGCPSTSTPSLPAAAHEEDQELNEVDRAKREIETAACAEREAELLQNQAAAYQAWEREELERELSRLSRKRARKLSTHC